MKEWPGEKYINISGVVGANYFQRANGWWKLVVVNFELADETYIP